MELINNNEYSPDSLVNQSLLVIGYSETGKSLIGEFVSQNIKEGVLPRPKVGVLSSPVGIQKFKELEHLYQQSLVLEGRSYKDFDVTTRESFVNAIDVKI